MSLISFMQRLLQTLRQPLINSVWGLADTVSKGLFRPYMSATAIYNATPTLATETAVDVSGVVPPQAIAVVAMFSLVNGGTTATQLQIYQNAGETNTNKMLVYQGVLNEQMKDCFIIPLDANRKFYIQETGAAVALLIKWVGWFEVGAIKQPLNIAQF